MDERNRSLELRSKLFALLKERAFRRGRVVLASGRESDFYFDMKPAMLDPDGARLMVELILQQLQGVTADCFGGLEMGAVPLITPVAMRSPCSRSGISRSGSRRSTSVTAARLVARFEDGPLVEVVTATGQVADASLSADAASPAFPRCAGKPPG